jgi:pectate lyase
VTVPWNRFHDHDKTNLVGSSDAGRLKVTFHHNHYENSMQRDPRVRYGQVHVYNNLYTAHRAHPAYPYVYFIGAGKSSSIYSERNYFVVPDDISVADLIKVYNGEAFHDEGSLLNGAPVDILAAYNAAHPDAPLRGDVGWMPSLAGRLDPAAAVLDLVRTGAGAGKEAP